MTSRNKGHVVGVAVYAVLIAAAMLVAIPPQQVFAQEHPQSFAELAGVLQRAEPGIKTEIEIADTLASQGDLELVIPEQAIVEFTGNGRLVGQSKVMLTVEKGASFTLNGPTLDGVLGTVKGVFELQKGKFTNVSVSKKPALLVSGGSLVLTGGEVSDNHVVDPVKSPSILPSSYVSPIMVIGGSLRIQGGSITNNTTNSSQPDGYTCAAAVTAMGQGTQVVMTSGLVDNNVALAYSQGGAFSIGGGTTFTLEGGTISNNVGGFGGGAYLFEGAHFRMTGGSFITNTARYNGGHRRARGGALCIDTNDAVITGGLFKGNHAETEGGAIYIDGTSSNAAQLTMTNALITHNRATLESIREGADRESYYGLDKYAPMGGGISNCPVGTLTTLSTRGLAVFGNVAEDMKNRRAAGDDVSFSKFSGASHEYAIDTENIMLGGGRNVWYSDGAGEGYWQHVNPNVPRMDPEHPEIIDDFNSRVAQGVAAHNAANEEHRALAREVADVVFEENYAMLGGAIANNGNLVVGEAGDLYDVVVRKVWNGVDEADQKPISFKLTLGGHVLTTGTLSRDNNWEASIWRLPALNTLVDADGKQLELTVDEADADDYDVTVEKTDGDHTYTLTITNKAKTPTPDPEPITPITPQPDVTTDTHTDEPTPEQKPAPQKRDEKIPASGDVLASAALPLAGGAVLIVAGAAVWFVKFRKQ